MPTFTVCIQKGQRAVQRINCINSKVAAKLTQKCTLRNNSYLSLCQNKETECSVPRTKTT